MIPQTFHRLWLGSEEPEWLRGFVEGWINHHPGWDLKQWDEGSLRAELFPLQNQDIYDHAEEIAPNHVGQLRSDVVRYELLAKFGGVWIDTDLECLRSVDGLIGSSQCFAAWEAQYRWIGNTILGSVPGHPAVQALIDGLPRNVRKRGGSRPNKLSGPQYLSRVWRARRDVTIFDQKLFFPYAYDEVADYGPGDEFPGAYTTHHWGNQRRERGIPV